jgi:ribosome-associated protein
MSDIEHIQPKSKSQVKRDLLALHDLGRELVDLSSKALHQLPLSDDIRRSIIEAKHLKMEALRRQLKHIGKLMLDEDAEAIHKGLATLRQPHKKEVSEFHEVESWRDKLLAGDDELLAELCGRFSQIDRQHLRQLMRNAKKEQALGKGPKSARALFRYLKDLSDDNNAGD